MGTGTIYVGAPIKVYNESQEAYDTIYPKTRADAVIELTDKKFVTSAQNTWFTNNISGVTVSSAQKSLLDALGTYDSSTNALTLGGSQTKLYLDGDALLDLASSGDITISSNGDTKFNKIPKVLNGTSYENVLLSSDILDSTSKIKASKLPDYILGQVKYGGVVASGGKLTLTSSARTILGDALGETATASTTDVSGTLSSLTDSEGYYTYSGTVNIGTSKTNVTISGGANYCSYNSSTGVVSYTLRGTTGGTTAYATISYYEEGAIVNNYITDINTTDTRAEGIYFMVASGITNVTIAGITGCSTGDWLIITGGAWTKIDNTDAVTSVLGLTGGITLKQLMGKINAPANDDEKLNYSNIYDTPTSLKNPSSLSMTIGATTTSYDGSSAISVDITPSAIGTYTSTEINNAIKAKSSAYVSSTEPSSPNNGDIWFQISQS